MDNTLIQKINLLREQADELMAVNTAQAVSLLTEAYQAIDQQEERTKVECGLQLATAYHKIKQELPALKIIGQCMDFSYLTGNLKNQIPFNELAAEIYTGLGQYDMALKHYLSIASAYTSVKDKQKLAVILNQIGETHKLLAEYSEAIKQHEKALKIFEEADSKEQLAVTNFYIGNAYNWADELDIAFNYLDKSLKLAERLRSPELKVKPLGSLGILFTKQKKYDRALDYFFEAIDNSNLSGNIRIKADLLKSLGNLYNQLQRYDEAIKVLHESAEICHNLNLKQPLHLVNLFLSDALAATGSYEKALHHHKEYHRLCRELQNEEVNLKTKSLQLKFDLDEIQRQKILAEQSLLLKDTFLANVSHEFRTPLNGIIGMADILNDAVTTEEYRKYVQTIRSSAFQLVDIIDEILDYARINTNQIDPVEQNFNIIETINESIEKFQLKFPAKKVESDTDFDNGEEVMLDSFILRKVLYNTMLFGGSFASSDKINLALYHSQNKLFINIKFNIAGKKNFPHPDDFFELNNPHFSQNGLNGYGLGLSLINAKGMVLATGGKISVKLESMKCSFVIELPYRSVKSDKRPPTTDAVPLVKDVVILLVEDNKINQFLAKTMLVKKGFKVELAADGDEAIAKLGTGRFNMVITDVQMPGMDGYQLAAHIRNNLSQPLNAIPIVALTAYESSAEKEKAKEAGMSAFLTKPYLPEQLFEVISQFVSVNNEQTPAVTSDINIHQIYDNLLSLMAGDKKETQALIRMFSNQFPDLLKEMIQSVESMDMKKLYKAAHKIKSSLKLLNDDMIDTTIDRIEKQAKEQNHTFELSIKVKELSDRVLSITQLLEKGLK